MIQNKPFCPQELLVRHLLQLDKSPTGPLVWCSAPDAWLAGAELRGTKSEEEVEEVVDQEARTAPQAFCVGRVLTQ